MAKKPHKATEQRTIEEALRLLPDKERHARTVLERLKQMVPIPAGAFILDVGSAQGSTLIALARQQYKAVGVEPWAEAREVAAQLAAGQGVQIEVADGVAEALPFAPETFRVVLAESVLEHVLDAAAAMAEACRVLEPGGIFWFSSASSLSPRQDEIAGFPCFGWYPDRLKRRIMAWAKVHKPHLVGHTQTPAINWFTPWKARRMLRTAGFRRVYDRWDLRQPSEGGRLHALLLRVIRLSPVTKCMADVLVGGCAYAAVK
ncbi:MAG TPA: class I SAM-dependent methyltransferase [Phycisphaerae bacterium]|nr:class I SAM-dependent methyltransferase [Phycisphaerae bacterium]